MHISYFDRQAVTKEKIDKELKRLAKYRHEVSEIISTRNDSRHEYALTHAISPELHETINNLQKQFSKIEHLVLVGIGGSNLGTEAVHTALDAGKVKLHTLDTTSAIDIERVLSIIKNVKAVSKIAICVISKSGGTAETLVNASILLESLSKKFGAGVYKQSIFIGDANTAFMKQGKKLGVICIAMPSIVGGRYSIGTEVGLVPLALLKHDVDAFISGINDASSPEFEQLTAEAAARISVYMSEKFRHYNFFAFEKRLEKLGAWYRQLFAESLGKSIDNDKKAVGKGMIPTVSTPVDLHSIGQLYLSGFEGVFTDFVSFDDDSIDFDVPKAGIAKAYGRFSIAEVAAAIYGGVIGAYQEKQLPYRATVFDEGLPYSLGLFMTMRMREVMYIAMLLNIDAFNQPNVELYKEKTRAILKI